MCATILKVSSGQLNNTQRESTFEDVAYQSKMGNLGMGHTWRGGKVVYAYLKAVSIRQSVWQPRAAAQKQPTKEAALTRLIWSSVTMGREFSWYSQMASALPWSRTV